MPSPFDRLLIADPETVAEWADYERKARRAAGEYRVLPIAANLISIDLTDCECGRRTRHEDSICRTCRGAGYATEA